jgi:hypothetical protein
MDVAQQNLLIHQHCVVCHTDTHLNGGLSLEHFDATHADPGIAAMLLSKITRGMPLAVLRASQSDSSIQTRILARADTGALRAAGRPMPDTATQIGLVAALTRQASDAEQWTVNHAPDTAITTASMVVEAPTSDKDTVTIYRLAFTCDAGSRQGSVLLAWANGTPGTGRQFAVQTDHKAAVTQTLEPGEKAFPGAMGTSGTGGVFLARNGEPGFALPDHTMTVRDIFPGDRVNFAFDGVNRAARSSLSACFPQTAG